MRAGLLDNPRRQAVLAAASYLVLSVIMTWPLARVIDSEIAWDMGDSLFNSWVLLWTGGQVLSFLSGDFSALNRFWHGNIFYPERLTVAYSEHLVPQMLQALPVLAATDNVVLAYNLLFLSTFVLSGLGAFLFVREVTGSPVAGFVAGLGFAFAPYRVSQYSHLQVLSAQWMPFVLYGFRRYFDTGRRRALVGGTAALVLQNLSCGYYLLFFAPFVGLYVVYEMASRGQLGQWRRWRPWILAGLASLILTLPFLTPYVDVRRGTDVGVRDPGEILLFSADTRAVITPAPALTVWSGRLEGFPRAEGEGFPGVVIGLLALLGMAIAAVRAARNTRAASLSPLPAWRQALVGALAVLVAVHLMAGVALLATGAITLPGVDSWIMIRRIDAGVWRALILVALLVMASPGLRRWLAGSPGSVAGFLAVSTVVALALTWGPEIRVAGQLVGTGPYAWLANLPGYDGVRVPARFFMLVALFLACLAGHAVAGLRGRSARAVVGAVAGLLMLAESSTGVFATNVRMAADGYLPTPRELSTGHDLPPIYKILRDDPDPVILLEFPFGVHAFDLHSVFYAGYHKRPLVNGFSGFFPESQRTRSLVFNNLHADPDAAWRALLASRATHVLVHEGAYPMSRREMVANWLRDRGAVEIMADGTNKLFRVE
jgi:hypothetical protein